MSQTQGKTNYGTLIAYGDGASPNVYTTVPEAYNIAALVSQADPVEMTHHESPGGWAEFIAAGVREGQEIVVECNEIYQNTQQLAVRSLHSNGTRRSWRIFFNSGATEIFPAIVINIETDAADIRGKQVFRFTLKIAGESVRT